MRLDMNCIPCNINQAIRISELLDLAPGVREDMMREIGIKPLFRREDDLIQLVAGNVENFAQLAADLADGW